MEESTSWKGHSFTLMIFAGIVVLCSIFFVLGMLVGRNQGQRIAEAAAGAPGRKPIQTQSADDDLKFYTETTEDNPVLKLQPAPDPPPAAAPAPAPASASQAHPAPPAAPPRPAATVKPRATPAPEAGTYLQVFATNTPNQAAAELKRVQSKGFKAKIVIVEQDKVTWNRVYVGPYKDSEVNLAKSDLKAKGYKDVIVRK